MTPHSKAALPGPQPTLVPVESTSTQSMHFLMVADEKLHLLHYRGPVDMRNEEHVRTAICEIWPDMIPKMGDTRAVNAKKKWLPQDNGMYYLVVVDTEYDQSLYLLIPDGEVVPFVFGLASKAGLDNALAVLPRYGMIPIRIKR